mmetsp:Transcript_16044/g.33312  ORF Transcript_16044/g.33312 Transcript_16044/m.33312 type:complete len:235 (-) Transcript_16044:110-814(-)
MVVGAAQVCRTPAAEGRRASHSYRTNRGSGSPRMLVRACVLYIAAMVGSDPVDDGDAVPLPLWLWMLLLLLPPPPGIAPSSRLPPGLVRVGNECWRIGPRGAIVALLVFDCRWCRWCCRCRCWCWCCCCWCCRRDSRRCCQHFRHRWWRGRVPTRTTNRTMPRTNPRVRATSFVFVSSSRATIQSATTTTTSKIPESVASQWVRTQIRRDCRQLRSVCCRSIWARRCRACCRTD